MKRLTTCVNKQDINDDNIIPTAWQEKTVSSKFVSFIYFFMYYYFVSTIVTWKIEWISFVHTLMFAPVVR
jgi:hypothetical protein